MHQNGMNNGVDGINPSILGQAHPAVQPQPPPEGTQHYCLRWNSYPATIATQLAQLKSCEDFVDVTLACDGQQLQAHKLVLAACSPYFMQLFKSTPCQHPVVFLRDVRFSQLRALLEFMYAGEVNVSQAELQALLRTAEALQVRGLADTTNNNNFSSPLAPQKPIFTEHQQYLPNTVHSQIPPVLPSIPPLQSPPQARQLQLDQLDSGNPGIINSEIAPEPTTSRMQLPPEGPESRIILENTASESSKENQMDASSSDSNDSQEEYVPGCQYDEKLNLHHDQHVIPLTSNSFANLNPSDADGCGMLPGAGPESWNLGLGSISLGGSQSEADMSDEDNDEDDGEIKEDFLLPPMSSAELSAYAKQDAAGESKLGPNGETPMATPGPSMNSNFPFPSPNADKSKDLVLSSNPNPPNNVPPRNRFSRALWPPGVPYHGPQQCPYCTRVLSNVGNWRKHVYTMHFSREKNFKCCHCNSSFRTSEYLQKHYVRVHSYAPKMSRKKSLAGGNGLPAPLPQSTLPGTLALTAGTQNT